MGGPDPHGGWKGTEMIFLNTVVSSGLKGVYGKGKEHEGQGCSSHHYHSLSSIFSPSHQGSVNSLVLLFPCEKWVYKFAQFLLRWIILRVKEAYSPTISEIWLLFDFISFLSYSKLLVCNYINISFIWSIMLHWRVELFKYLHSLFSSSSVFASQDHMVHQLS